jgi:hypothetical protein
MDAAASVTGAGYDLWFTHNRLNGLYLLLRRRGSNSWAGRGGLGSSNEGLPDPESVDPLFGNCGIGKLVEAIRLGCIRPQENMASILEVG